MSKLSAAAHTKLKFRQPGQTNQGEVQRRDLKAELAAAERAAEDKKRKAAGLPPLPIAGSSGLAIEDKDANGSKRDAEGDEEDERAKRRRLLEEALEADKDDDGDGMSKSMRREIHEGMNVNE